MNGDSSGNFCNYCETVGHFYTECALAKFDELVVIVAKKLDEEKESKQAGYRNIPYPGDSVYDHMHQRMNYKFPESDVHWGSFWSTERRDDSADLQGPDDWYNEGGAGDF